MERALLSEARQKRHWSLEEAASRIGVDRATLMRWEKGRSMPQPLHIRKLCEVYEATAQELGLLEEAAVAACMPASTAEEKEHQVLVSFMEADLTMRLLHIVWIHHARYRDIQELISLELEDNCMNADPINRRDALRRLALIPIELCSLSSLVAVLKRPNEEIIAHCAAGTTACWHLRRGKDLSFVDGAMSKYIPTLTALTTSASSSAQRLAAADLLVQALLLKTVLAWNLASPAEAISYARQAEHYSTVLRESNPAMQILALRTLAAAYCYDQQWQHALQAGEKAIYLLETAASPVHNCVQSYVYAGLATYQSYHHQEDAALLSLKKAHTTFLAQSESEPAPIWVDHEIGNLFDNDGLTHFHLGHYQEAIDAFSQVPRTSKLTCRMTAMIEQAMAEVDRDDKPRDMQLCINLVCDGVAGAKELHSTRILNSAAQVYRAMRAAWPYESRIKEMHQLFIEKPSD